MKTTIQWLKEYLETKILPCNEDNEYVYGMNVAHNNLIEYIIPYLLEKEKEQLLKEYHRGMVDEFNIILNVAKPKPLTKTNNL